MNKLIKLFILALIFTPFFAINAQVAVEICDDGDDNNNNTLIDSSDPSCSEFFPAEEEEEEDPTPTPSSGGGGGGGSVAGSSIDLTEDEGELLGASIDTTENSCTPLTSFLRRGQANSADQVQILQNFLNKDLGLNLPATGFFGPLTESAVNQFQAKYSAIVLRPWVNAGYMDTQTPTGYMYKTTRYMVNILQCPTVRFIFPDVSKG